MRRGCATVSGKCQRRWWANSRQPSWRRKAAAPRARPGDRPALLPRRRADGGLGLEARFGEAAGDGVPHLTRRELAPVQVRRQPRAALEVGAVAVVGVRGQDVVEQPGEAGASARLARLPFVAEPRGPGLHGVALEVGGGEAGGDGRRGSRHLRRRQRVRRPQPAARGAPEGREHLVGPALRGLDGVRGDEQRGRGHDDRLDACVAEGAAGGLVLGALGRVDAACPDDPARAGLGGQPGDGRRSTVGARVGGAHQERGAAAPQVVAERDQGAREPPARGGAGHASAGRVESGGRRAASGLPPSRCRRTPFAGVAAVAASSRGHRPSAGRARRAGSPRSARGCPAAAGRGAARRSSLRLGRPSGPFVEWVALTLRCRVSGVALGVP